MNRDRRMVAITLWPDGTETAELFKCDHQNVFGCPNHGDLARSLVRPLPRVMKDNYRQVGMQLCPAEHWPIPYTVTERGKALLEGRQFTGEAWE